MNCAAELERSAATGTWFDVVVEITVRVRAIRAFWSLAAVAACSTAGDADRASETQIQRVINGLHVRQSAQTVSAEKWTLDERMAHHGVPDVTIAVIHDGRIECRS